MKTQITRLLCLLLCAVMTCGTVAGVAAATEEEQLVTLTQRIVPTADLPESDELYEGYLEQLFYGNSVATFGLSARAQLNPLGQKLYDFLKEKIQAVAAGESASTAAYASSEMFISWGAEVEFAGDDPNAVFTSFREQFEMGRVLDALLHDCPYELYWFDKIDGLSQRVSFYGGDGSLIVAGVDFSFAVVGDYQPSGYDAENPTIDQTGVATAASAAAYAQSLVDGYAGYGNYEKLNAYKTKICELVSYDHAAASGGDFSADADPWQLIHVFDQDTSTGVVCEGYSKAFQYLCDLSTFGGDVACYTVTGVMAGGTGAGDHMWNIVTIGGENYLVDVTNSDTGTVGQDGELFLAGTAGSVSAGYNFDGTVFTYGSQSKALWGTGADSILTLAATSYDPASEEEESFVASGTCGDNLTWTLDEEGTLTITGSGTLYPTYTPAWSDYIDSVKALVLSEGITTVAAPGIVNHQNLTSVSLPDTQEELAGFSGCTALEQITLPDGLTSIGSNAFSDCTSLTVINLPASVTELGARPFAGCTSLTGIWVDSASTAFASDSRGVLYSKDMTSLVEAPGALQGDYTIPNGVTSIMWGAFDCCVNVTSVVIPEGVGYLDLETFFGCSALKSVAIPETVTGFAQHVFKDCASLTTLTIPASVTWMDPLAIVNCPALTEVFFMGSAPGIDGEIFSNVTATAYYPIGDDSWTEEVMENCGGTITWVAYDPNAIAQGTWGDNLTWVLSEDGILTISGSGEMEGADWSDEYNGFAFPWIAYREQIRALVVETGVTTIAEGAFRDCPMTTAALPETLNKIGTGAFADSGLIEIEIPDSVTNIGMSAFYGCADLTSAKLPAGLTFAAEGVFGWCTSLATVVMPEMPNFASNDQYYFYAMFEGCTALTDIDFHTSSIIGYYMYSECEGLEEVVIPDCVTTIYDGAFLNCVNLRTVTIPASVTEWKPEIFDGEAFLTEIRFEGDAPFFDTEAYSGRRPLDGVTATAYYPANNATWTEAVMASYGGDITWVAEKSGDEGWGDNLKWNLSEDGTLTISGSGMMDEGTWNEETQSYDYPWLAYSDSIKKLVLEEGVESIATGAFSGCGNLTSVQLPDSLFVMQPEAFANTGLTEIVVPDSVTLTSGLFSGCVDLVSVKLPNVRSIPASCFEGCVKLAEIELPACDMILENAFAGCVSLERITIPSKVSMIMSKAFSGCTGLKEVTFEGAPPYTMEADIFAGCNLTAFYPADNASWTADAMQNYGGTIEWVPFGEQTVIGDFTGDGEVTEDDVATLLWSVLFPDMYPIEGEADFTDDGVTNEDDVAALLWSVLFPDLYPL